MSARIEIPMDEYQGLRNKIKKLESALDSISKEAAVNKELIEKTKALVADMENEGFINRLFKWKNLVKPLSELLNGKVQKTLQET